MLVHQRVDKMDSFAAKKSLTQDLQEISYGSFLKWGIPESPVSILEWSSMTWMMTRGTTIFGNLHTGWGPQDSWDISGWTIVNGVYKPTYNWGAIFCMNQLAFLPPGTGGCSPQKWLGAWNVADLVWKTECSSASWEYDIPQLCVYIYTYIYVYIRIYTYI